jgi:Fic family protein
MCHVYETFQEPLSHDTLYKWQSMLIPPNKKIERGQYRTHTDPMQIVSNKYGSSNVYFEAPPSENLPHEMDQYIDWFNQTFPTDLGLGHASIAHVYFESIHPFEDGNGRVGRALVEKALSLCLGQPTLMAISNVIQQRKKEYYTALGECNRTLGADNWTSFFSELICQAQKESMNRINFLIEKSKLLTPLSGIINARQEKTLLRMFSEGLGGFSGGLSAENYLAITKTSRATATRDLNDLVEKKVLIKTGEKRHTRYWLNINLT